MKKFSILLYAVILSAGVARGSVIQGEVRGMLTRLESPYMVVGAVTVPASDTLVIEPGVVIIFNGLFKFTVNGVLIANGTTKDSIFFSYSNHTAGGWDGIRFDGNYGGKSSLKCAGIFDATRGIGIAAGADPTITRCRIYNCKSGIITDGGKGTITYCDISATDGSGVVIDGSSHTRLRNCNVFDCTQNGVSVSSVSVATIDSNYISVVHIGIKLSTSQPCSLSWNRVERCGDLGISLSSTNGTVVMRNIVSRSQGNYSIEINRANNNQIYNNTVADNKITGIHVYASNGIQMINNISVRNGRNGIEAQNANFTNMQKNCVFGNSVEQYVGVNPGLDDLQQDPNLDGEYWPVQGSPVIDMGYQGILDDPDGSPAEIGARFWNHNQPPSITSFQPQELSEVEGLTEVNFTVTADDPEGMLLSYHWFVGDVPVGTNQPSFTYRPTLDGKYTVTVIVDDGLWGGTDNHVWAFTVGVNGEEQTVPTRFAVTDLYPNPFNSRLNATLALPGNGWARMSLCDLNGRTVMSHYFGNLNAGSHALSLNGAGLKSTVYLLSIRTPFGTEVRKVVLLK